MFQGVAESLARELGIEDWYETVTWVMMEIEEFHRVNYSYLVYKSVGYNAFVNTETKDWIKQIIQATQVADYYLSWEKNQSNSDQYREALRYWSENFHPELLWDEVWTLITSPVAETDVTDHTPTPITAPNYLARYEAKHGVDLYAKAESDNDWYMNSVYPLSLENWAKAQLESVSF